MIVATPDDTIIAYLGLGSNLGHRVGMLRAAVCMLDDGPRIQVDRKSGIGSLYETSPVGASAPQPAYLNSAVRVRTPLSALGLLDRIQSIEAALGRVRREQSEARVIDIDLLLYGDVLAATDRLVLPHPRLHERHFVLAPLSDIAKDIEHPRGLGTIGELASRCRKEHTDQTVRRLTGPDWINDSYTPPGEGW